MDELAIKIEHVSKQYRLGAIGGGTLQADLQSWWARVRGKEDPNSKIGSENHNRKIGERFLALDDINLEVKKGEALGIIGHNGAGKSTLLKLLSRVTAPTEGKISYNGRITSMLEVGTGFHGELTGRENIYMNGAILGMTKKEIDAKMEQIIDFSEVRQFIDTPVKRYSSGMYVKLAFSVAAHLDSEIMIMDEVLAVGDMAFQKKCLTKMREAATKEGRTVLYVSHNMNTIRQLCDRCVVLDKGKIVFNGDVEEGVGMYLGSKCNHDTFVDLSLQKRDPEFNPHPVTMQSMEILSESAILKVGSSMELKLVCRPEKLYDNAYLRVIVKTIEGVPVTMFTCRNGRKLVPEIDNVLKFEIDVSRLVPGQYTLSPVIYEVNEQGTNINLDGLKEVLGFEIVAVPGFNHNMPWASRYWGTFYNEPFEL